MRLIDSESEEIEMIDVNSPDASESVRDDATASKAKKKMADAAGAVKEKIGATGESIRSATSSARSRYGEIRSKVGDADYAGMLADLRNYVRENPGKAVVISVGAGFLIGLLLRDSED
jgi:ElaB/YqjD/DUF883 family membrane-anchored ribosome-binding protein